MGLEDYLRVLRAHWVGILLITALGVAVAAGWVFSQPKVYQADASIYVSVSTGEDDNIGLQMAGTNLINASMPTYIDVGSSRAVAEDVIEELGLERSPESLVRSIDVSNQSGTAVLSVTARGNSPESARTLAEAWVRSMISAVNELQTGDAATTGSLELTPGDSARLPQSPISPNVRLSLALGLGIGLALGIAYAVVRFMFDRRIRSSAQIEKETGVPVVGTIPKAASFTDESHILPLPGTAMRGASDEVHAVCEAMRSLRSNIQFMNVDNPPRVIVVSSPLPGDGKSTTSANLALTIAASGQRVILIDGDLRRPTVMKEFNLIQGAGLTDVLAGSAEIEDVAQRYGEGNLVIIGPGQIPPNPSELLGSQRMADLLSMLAEQAIVIVDAPPLIPVTDAAVLAHRADGAIIVTKAGRTTYEMLRQALRKLDQVHAQALGIVLNQIPRKGAESAYYGYQYRGTYYRNEGAEQDNGEQADAPTARSSSPTRRSRRRTSADSAR